MNEQTSIQTIQVLMVEQHINTTKTLDRMEKKLDAVTEDHQELTERVVVLETNQVHNKAIQDRVSQRLWAFAGAVGIAVVGLILERIF
jgi:hypothetical protein